MRIFDRIILILFSFLLITFSLITFCMALGWTLPLDYLNTVFNSVNNRWIIGISSVIIFIAGLAHLVTSISVRPESRTQVILTEHGEISITVPAVETLVKKAAFSIKGVREVKPLIKITSGGIAVLMKVAMMPGTVIPESAQELQSSVKNYLQQTAGLEVVEVKVLVTEVAQESKGRVN